MIALVASWARKAYWIILPVNLVIIQRLDIKVLQGHARVSGASDLTSVVLLVVILLLLVGSPLDLLLLDDGLNVLLVDTSTDEVLLQPALVLLVRPLLVLSLLGDALGLLGLVLCDGELLLLLAPVLLLLLPALLLEPLQLHLLADALLLLLLGLAALDLVELGLGALQLRLLAVLLVDAAVLALRPLGELELLELAPRLLQLPPLASVSAVHRRVARVARPRPHPLAAAMVVRVVRVVVGLLVVDLVMDNDRGSRGRRLAGRGGTTLARPGASADYGASWVEHDRASLIIAGRSLTAHIDGLDVMRTWGRYHGPAHRRRSPVPAHPNVDP
jgi:hypothetical protein